MIAKALINRSLLSRHSSDSHASVILFRRSSDAKLKSFMKAMKINIISINIGIKIDLC